MQIRVSREACCSQDDQLGPLQKTYVLPPDATLRELVEAIVASSFLQFSSSHTLMVGEAGPTGLVMVSSPHDPAHRENEFLAPPDAQVGRLIPDSGLRFRFVVA